MKQIVFFVVCLFFVVGATFVGAAQVNININVPPPPPLEFAAEPDVVVVPSGTSDVYLVPDTVGLYFYGGYWYRFYGDHWFRASLYSGPWIGVGLSLVPSAVVVIPPDYILGVPPGYHRIHYGDFHGHWRDWGRNHYWNRHDWYRDHSHHHWGGRDFHRRPPGHHGDVHHGGEVHRKTESHHGGEVHRKADVGHGGGVHPKTGVSRKSDVHRAKDDGPHK